MSSQWDSQGLLQPIAADQPCGENLEDTPLLASFDSFRLFGNQVPFEAAKIPDWEEIKNLSLEGLARSKDLRLLAYLGTALLRTDGLPAFSQTIQVASQWLDTNWAATYPLVDEDAIVRRSALNCFADQIAVVDGLRRTPLVSNRQLGRFSLRDIEIATGVVTPADGDSRPDEKQIDAAFMAMPLGELKALRQVIVDTVGALKRIDGQMRQEAGPDAAPSFEPLQAQLSKVDKVLQKQLEARPDAEPGGEAAEGGVAPTVGVNVRGIASREDAIRALDAVAEFFRRSEPSSPVPLLVDRAKRLVSKNFLEVLQELAPGGLDEARSAGGVREE